MRRRVERLPKINADTKRYQNEPYKKNPLLRFSLADINSRRHYELLKKKAIEEKIRICREADEPIYDEDTIPLSDAYYVEKLRECAAQAPVPSMQIKTERKILSYIPQRHRNKYPHIVSNYMKDVHNEFDETIKKFSRQTILVVEGPKPIFSFHYKFPGKTKSRYKYLRNRDRLKKLLLIPYGFIRCICNYAEVDFPNIINDYSKYKKDNNGLDQIISVPDFRVFADNDLMENVMFLNRTWYPKILAVIRRHYNRLRTLPPADWPRAINCASGLINRKLTEWKIRTFDHINEMLMDCHRVPFFKLKIICLEKIDLSPTFDAFCDIFHNILDSISNVGNRLEAIEYLIDSKILKRRHTATQYYEKVDVGQKYMEEAHAKLRYTMHEAYRPVLDFIQNFKDEYQALYETEDQVLDEFLSESRSFDEYLNQIEVYHGYITRLRKRMRNIYFDMAVVDQMDAIESLKKIAQRLIERVSEKIVEEHRNDCLDICNEFDIITSRALETPKSTEMLLANGEYMLEVKTKTLFRLKDRIQENLRVGGQLVELKELSPAHTKLQVQTIRQFNSMADIQEQNATLFEMYKFQFEEHLGAVTRKLSVELEEMIPNLAVIDDMCEEPKFREYNALLLSYIDQLTVFDDYVTWINKEEIMFKFPVSVHPVLNEIKDFVIPFATLMKRCIQWLRYFYVWMDGPFEYLEPDFVTFTTESYGKEFLKTQRYYRNRIKADMIGQPVCKFKGQTEDPDPENHPVPLKLCNRMIEWIKGFALGVRFVNILCNPALRTRHWAEMSEIAGFDITPDAGTTLRKLINANLEEKLDEFEIVSVGANKELQLQNSLAAMIKEWETIVFPTGPYKDTDIQILQSLDDIQALLDEHILKTLTMRGSAFVKPCEKEVRMYYDKLLRVNATIEEWGKVQANWLYLMPIFSSKDIVAQMPEEGRLFTQVNQTYRNYLGQVLREPLVMVTAPLPGLLEAMIEANELLEQITDGVNNYLEKKRLYFPRFFFLSNDEMLEILSETKNPLRVQPHINKCFEGIGTLEFNDRLEILSMFSTDMESIPFVEIISTEAARGSVEKWLVQVEEQMLIAVKNELQLSYNDYLIHTRPDWTLKWSQMVVLCISQVFWATGIHTSFELVDGRNRVPEMHKKLTDDLNEIVALIRSTEITNLNRISLKALIVIDVHGKDVVQLLIDNNVKTADDFDWLAQLRYYVTNEAATDRGCVSVKIINATVPYANEYLGNSDRLVITPLTDRCYRTLVGAYQLHLNGAPEGPAGTGKTETTKDLAKALAVQCKVFNCSDGLDYKAMGKFFKGLASSGAWACFDEFNRIELEVLSVVAQQILSIINAVRANVETFIFEKTELVLNKACYVCITMNPGYAGRSELPDNLKVLFRTVAMMVPDYAMIGEISLYSFGFVNARSLAVKIVTTYRLCSEQLSSQNHYDYGMRAVKTVLSACGNLKKAQPDENEDILLLKALLDVNLPKFLSFDVPLFNGIVADLFPGVSLPEADYSLMQTAFTEICADMNLQPVDSFFEKVIQTFEMIIVRHGFMMVGEPFAGKSSVLKVLAKMLSKLKPYNLGPYYQDVQMDVVNPKAITMSQLYGAFDPVSYEWTDGIASTIFRTFAKDTTLDRKFLIFDGPVDAVWIENMNTVLDDNKKLCLTSGEVITMSSETSMIFEVMDLSQASPATVSRCGMIYMEPGTLGWKVFFLSWLNDCDEKWIAGQKEIITELFEWQIPDCIAFVRRQCTTLVPSGEFNWLHTTLSLFQMIMDDACEECPEDEIQRYAFIWIQATMIYSMVWGIGGILDIASRERFDAYYRSFWAKLADEESDMPDNLRKMDLTIPLDGLFCEYVYIYKQRGAWKYWPELIRRQEPESGPGGLQVATVDTGRYLHILDMHIKHKKKMLLVGPTGTGKSFYTQNTLMNRLSLESYAPAFITFTVMITATQTQELIISKLNKIKKNRFGPPKGTLAVFFIDDMNMPAKEVYGAQPPIELLRQFFDYGYVYELKDTGKIFLENILFLSACGIPGGSRQDVYRRFLCHFNIFSINNFSEVTMTRIFSSVLLNGYKNRGHTNEVNLSVNHIVNATLSIYYTACKDLRPTPAKCHYIFNLRDIARVVLGCSLMRKESAEDKKVFARIWFHESMRIFYDRLIEKTDRAWFFTTASKCIVDFFKDKVESAFAAYADDNGDITIDSVNNMIFGTYFDMDSEPEDRRYEEVQQLEQFKNKAMEVLTEYNSTHKAKMDICLFGYAIAHLTRIARVLSMPAGSSLLVGISGSGRQSLTRLAAAMLQQEVFQPMITNNYGLNEWHEDLKKVLKESGGRGKDYVFLFTEDQIKMEQFLTEIDCLLNLGEVPNIFQIDERQEILELVRLAAQGGNRNLDISPLQVFTFFVNRCKKNLHIVLCFSPIGQAFRTRIRLYPSLANCCTINWFDSWPEEALEMVGWKYIKTVQVADDLKPSIVVICKHFHVTARDTAEKFFNQLSRRTYITSASFLELIKAYATLISKKQKDLTDAKMRYINGLDQLNRADKAVREMEINLKILQPELIKMAKEIAETAAEIEQKTIESRIAVEQVNKDQIVANVQAAASQVLKDDCEKDLAQAVPVLEEALRALNTLKPADITLVKSMKNPPETVKLVMASVCVIKGLTPDKVNDPATGKKVLDYWPCSKRILGEMTFLQQLKDFDRDNINPDIMKRIRKEFIPHKDFKPQIVAKASSAAEGLCKWMIAMDKYDAVAKVVAPKKAALAAAEKEYTDTMELLRQKKELLEELERNVNRLNAELAEASAKKEMMDAEVQACTDKLRRSEALLSGLGGEKDRWIAAANSLDALFENLPGDILISSGVIAYLAPFNSAFRTDVTTNWLSIVRKHEIPASKVFNLTAILGNEVTIQSWNICGLPRDSFSTENAIIMANASRFSLFIDPQGQAQIWLKTMEKANRLHIVKFSQGDYMRHLKKCIEFGYPALMVNIQEELEPPLDPLLIRNTFIQGGIEYINLGDDFTQMSPNFRFYMTTNLRNPHYLPEICNKVVLVNFALTQEGLEDQLLGIVVAKERPDLQELRETLIIESANNKASLVEVENRILCTLGSANILEDESAIGILSDSKSLAIDIKEKQEAAEETTKTIEIFRESYQPVAVHSANLYYCITDLPNVDPMYQFSLNWYINLYIFSIENANKSKNLDRRREFLVTALTKNLYNNICRSVFERDKLLFSFILTTKIMIAKGDISDQALLFLLTGGMDATRTMSNPEPHWITDKVWTDVNKLQQIKGLEKFVKSFVENISEWHDFYDHIEPQELKLSSPWENNASSFEKLLILKAIRPDKIAAAIRLFVTAEMGAQFVSPPPFDIAKSFEDSNCLSPLIFILSPGADPMGALSLFAEKMGLDETFKSISLGQGQGPLAEAIINEAQENGTWVCLQNCHLAASWMPRLEQLWEQMDLSNTTSTFRLWLTSYPSVVFPINILQNGVKMTNEPPTGLKQNLLRSYQSEPMDEPTFYLGCPGNDKAFAKLLYGICFFHAVVQERRKFGPIGWNIAYGFNESDFQISVLQLQMFLNQYEEVPYVAISYLTGECNYGGRVTDAWDRRAIVTILADYVNEDVVKSFTYKLAEGDAYLIPRKIEHREIVNHIENNIPNLPPPEVYGLHSNAGIVRDLSTSQSLLESMILASGQMGGSKLDSDSDNVLKQIISDIRQRLPSDYDLEIASIKYPVDYNESMNTVLVQEMERFNKLLVVIRETCVNVEKAIEGLIVMTPDMEEICNHIMFKKVPLAWMSKSYPSLKPIASYVTDFIRRLMWLQNWYENGKPTTFWLSGFFFTQAFLTGAMQNYARRYKIPIDLLGFDFYVKNVMSSNTSPEDGVYINGLFLEGARWNISKTRLEESLPKILAVEVPMIHFVPIISSELDESTRYKCPLYKTTERKGTLSTTGHSTNYVLPILLTTKEPPSLWIKRSVALMCQTGD